MHGSRALRAIALALALWCGAAAAAEWRPSRGVELIAASAPGGGLDRVARAVQRAAEGSGALDVPFVVVNRPGGNYTVAWRHLRQHDGDDGHQLLLASLGLIANDAGGASSVPVGALVPVARLYSEYVVLSVRADSTLASGRALAQRLAQEPAGYAIGMGGGPRGANYLATAMALRAAGVPAQRLRLVALRSSAAAMVAVLGGHVAAAATPVSVALPHLAAGRIRVLAISAPRRLTGVLAEVPTWREQGIEAEFDNFRMVLALRGTPAAQIAYWEEAFRRLAGTAAWRRELEANGWDGAFLGARETGAFLARQQARLGALMAELAGDR